MRFEHIITRELRDRYVSHRWWPPDSSLDFLTRNARRYPNKVAFVDARNRVTWKQMEQYSDRLAIKLLELGLKSGEDVIAHQLPSSMESYVVSYAAMKAGLMLIPVGHTMRHAEIEHLVGRTEAVVVVIRPQAGNHNFLEMYQEMRPKLPSLKHIILVDGEEEGTLSLREIIEDPAEERHPRDYLHPFAVPLDQPTWAMATSGTTGMPKLCLELGYAAQTDDFVERLRVVHEDVALACATIYGGASGLVCLPYAAAPYVGAKIVLMERWNAEEALRLIEREKVTIATGVPTQIIQMLAVPDVEKKYDLSSLRIFYYAGAVLPAEAASEVERRIGCQVITLYGSVGAGCFTQTGVDDPAEKRHRTVGKPLSGNEVEIRDDEGRPLPQGQSGEIVVRGPGLRGCFSDPALNREFYDENLFYHTGDLGMFDEEGFLHIVGRKKDVIIRGGQNVMPAEIEGMLLTHPSVADVAVIGMPDPVMGERVCAYVVLKEGQTFTFQEMVDHLDQKKTAKYKWPERLELIDELPLSSGGKVAKARLREDIAYKLQVEAVAKQ